MSNPRVFAAGDVASTKTLPLTPLSGKEGAFVAKNIVSTQMGEWDSFKAMPSIVFTIPKLAQVGMSKDELNEKKIDYTCKEVNMTRWLTNKVKEEPISLAKILIEEKTGKVLGAHFLSQQADEWVNIFSLAIQLGITSDQLTSINSGYPTVLSDMRTLLGTD